MEEENKMEVEEREEMKMQKMEEKEAALRREKKEENETRKNMYQGLSQVDFRIWICERNGNRNRNKKKVMRVK